MARMLNYNESTASFYKLDLVIPIVNQSKLVSPDIEDYANPDSGTNYRVSSRNSRPTGF